MKLPSYRGYYELSRDTNVFPKREQGSGESVSERRSLVHVHMPDYHT